MHLQNAAKIAHVSRSSSTEPRQRLQIQKCGRKDRLPENSEPQQKNVTRF